MSHTPTVSIIIPCYNAEKYIAQAIESALNQTFKDFELIIVNDGSTDGSENIINSYLQLDDRLQYYFQENNGVATARNLGLRYSRGEIISFLDSDDVWEAENLEVKVKTLRNNKDIHWVYSDLYIADNMLNKVDTMKGGFDGDILNSLLYRKTDVIQAPSGIVLKRECIFKYGIEFDKQTTPSEDWDLCIQISALNFKGKRIEKPLWTYRVLPDSLSRNLKTLETGNLLVLDKATKTNLFQSFWFRQKCYSNTYLILAGSWWVNGGNKFRGIYLMTKALTFYPPIFIKIIQKAI